MEIEFFYIDLYLIESKYIVGLQTVSIRTLLK